MAEVQAYILIQTEVGKAAQVAKEVNDIDGVDAAEDVTGPYDVIVRASARQRRRPRQAGRCKNPGSGGHHAHVDVPSGSPLSSPNSKDAPRRGLATRAVHPPELQPQGGRPTAPYWICRPPIPSRTQRSLRARRKRKSAKDTSTPVGPTPRSISSKQRSPISKARRRQRHSRAAWPRSRVFVSPCVMRVIGSLQRASSTERPSRSFRSAFPATA